MDTTEFFPSIFPSIFTFMSFFDSPVFTGTIYNHNSTVISHEILYTSHLYGIVILGIFQPMDSKNFIITSWHLYCSVGIGRIVWHISRLFHFRKYQICIQWYRRCPPGDAGFWDSDKCKVFSILNTRKFLQQRLADCLLLYSTLSAFNYTSNALINSERGRLLHYIQIFVLHSFICSTFS